MPSVRDSSGRFVKGHSGNPAGYPKQDPEVREILKAALPHAARRLVELMNSKKEVVAIKAIEIVFDRTQGKAPQAVQMSLDGGLDIRAQIRQVLLEKMKEQRTENADNDSGNDNGTDERGIEISD